jgi:hypothetical protein
MKFSSGKVARILCKFGSRRENMFTIAAKTGGKK